MCGRFILMAPGRLVAHRFSLKEEPKLEPRYNIAPGQQIAAIRKRKESRERELQMLKWGLIPFWAKDKKIGYKTINARSETAAKSPAFRAAFKYRRCIIPADGFYEWKKEKSGKQPYLIRMEDLQPFGLAGLWEHWQGPDDEIVESCTILTTTPNETLKDLHNRMPVILEPQDYDLWLDVSVQDARRLERLLAPYASDKISVHPVSKRVNTAANDDPQCIEPLEDPERT